MTMPKLPAVLLPLSVVVGVMVLVSAAARSPVHPVPVASVADVPPDLPAVVERVNALFQRQWAAAGVEPAPLADDLQVLRRLSLALHGTVPSLEEIRRFEADQAPQRLERWTLQLLNDNRFADYFAARLARSLIGAEQGQFILFRRDQFTNWLAEQIRQERPYDEIVRQMIADEGLWTGRPATNFITQAFADGNLDPNKLAGRTARAFLGQRIDCAQCHNHPFADWKQQQFEGLAACFAQARATPLGIHDDAQRRWEVEDRQTQEKRVVPAAVPFGDEWWPAEGSPRERLAAWVTHPQNRRLERAVVNRVWGLLFGRPYHAPVDDVPNPPEPPDLDHDLLDLLGHDFRAHRFSLKRLVQIIAAARPFRLASRHPAYEFGIQAELVEQSWAAFPLVRLRPEQMIGAMVQAASIKTIDQNSHLFTRLLRLIRENDFLKEYGDLGEQELEDRSGTIPQALLRMNGRFAAEISDANILNAPGRLTGMAPSDEDCVNLAYLCCLTRYPTPAEREYFCAELKAHRQQRGSVVEDLYWTLFNSPEFCWNH
jgi:hypothetical protein